MKIHLPTTIEVEIGDRDLLSVLEKKRSELLDGADYAEQEEGTEVYWLWKAKTTNTMKPPVYVKMREMSELEYQLLGSLTSAQYLLQKKIDEK